MKAKDLQELPGPIQDMVKAINMKPDYYVRPDSVPVLDTKTGKAWWSCVEGSKALGFNRAYIANHIRRGGDRFIMLKRSVFPSMTQLASMAMGREVDSHVGEIDYTVSIR